MYFHVIMPVGADAETSKKQALISRVAESENLRAHFPNYLPHTPIFDLEGEISDIQGAAFVFADLSFERPSCYYELGLAQALGKRIYLVAREGTDIHQTAYREKVIFFESLAQFEKVLEGIVVNGKRETVKS